MRPVHESRFTKLRGQVAWPRLAVFGLLALMLLPGVASGVAAQRFQRTQPKYYWHKINESDGIKVYAKDHPERSLPSFRGVGVVKASVRDILAVLFDTAHNCEWMDRCVESRVLKEVGETERIVYTRTGAPWPVSDRDVIVRTSVQYDARTGQVRSPFESVRSYPGAAPVDGVVRMTTLAGYYHFVPLGDERTRVTFEVDADPGGALPAFVVKWASRSIPIDQINGLRQQVKRLRPEARRRIAGWHLWSTPAAPAKQAKEAGGGVPAAEGPRG